MQSWLTNPAGNAGWIVLGDETTNQSVCQIASKQLGTSPPSLAIGYRAPAQESHFESWLKAYFPSNLTGQYVNPASDGDGDSIANQIEYAYGLNPSSFNTPTDTGLTTTVTPAALGAVDLTITFWRDSLATDLTYELQTGADVSAWTTIARSAGGATATGQNSGQVVSDNALSGSLRLVTVKQVQAPGTAKRFVQLKVDRR